MMNTFIRYDLDYAKTIEYFLEKIHARNIFYLKVIEHIDFKKGCFFTLLDDSAHLEGLYEFDGGIIPEESTDNPRFKRLVDTKAPSFDLIMNFVNQNPNNKVVFDQYIEELGDLDVVGTDVKFYEKKVYYIINKGALFESVRMTVRRADLLWHLLGVLTEDVTISDELTSVDFDRVCINAKYVITTAYDKDGYIFWEKNK